jgi:ATP-dependent DNA helicase RecG
VVDLDTPLRDVLGRSTAAVLTSQLGCELVGDLLAHLPRRYDERGELTDLADLVVGTEVTLQAQVVSVDTVRLWKSHGTMVKALVTDGRGTLPVTFFNQRWRAESLRPGSTVLLAGKVEEYREHLQMTNPEVQVLDGDGADAGIEAAYFAGGLMPIYPAVKGLLSSKIGKCVRMVLDLVTDVEDPLPAQLRRRYRLPDLHEAYELVHRPTSRADVGRGRHRLKWDEAFVLQVALARRRRDLASLPATSRPVREGGLLAAFDAALPFPLTAGQLEVGAEIAADMAGTVPMHRLLQGEVGSGKTVVALRAMLTAVDAGGQAVLLAPTETLAAQHCRSLRELLGPLGRAGELDAAEQATRVVLLTGSTGVRARRTALAAAADGGAGLIVGTHALLHGDVAFHDLALVVVDEQHRFGVEQRDVLRARARQPPHVLVMTATPIPRTVAMTVFGDLEVSGLTELPPGRSPVRTFVVTGAREEWVARMWGRIRDEVAAGRQAYVVCPRIGTEDPDAGQPAAEPEQGAGRAKGAARPKAAGRAKATARAKATGAGGVNADADARTGAGVGAGAEGVRPSAAVAEVFPLLAEGELAGLRLAALHGRLPADEREAVMAAFTAGSIDVLVATTVIEVGVDVPNATVMVILDADRFGVSQLHQLRGRVGRGAAAGWCLLHTATAAHTPAAARLTAVASTTDGAELARLDLAQRREGDVLGSAQSGVRRSLRLLELLKDEELIRDARAEAAALVADDPQLSMWPGLTRALAAALDDPAMAFLEKG